MAKVNPDDWALNPVNLSKLEEWASNGLTYQQIAKNMGISKPTLTKWRQKYPTVEFALSKGRASADEEVVSALFRRCTGFCYEEKRRKVLHDKLTGKNQVEESIVTHFVPGDVKAQIFWLTNKRPDEWKSKREDGTDQTNNIILRIEGGDDLAR